MSKSTFEFRNQVIDSKPKKVEEEKPTYRFELSLESSEAGYAEFNYLDLVATHVKENGENEKEINVGGSFSSKSTKRVDVCQYFNYDKVIGYDTKDSFIDDSELFDEYVDPSSHGFHISGFDDKNENVRLPEKLDVKKPKVDFVLTTPKKSVKPNKKRRARNLPPTCRKTKRSRYCSAYNDDVQIIGEIFKSPISQVEKPVDKTYKVNVSTKVDNEYPLPSNLSEDLKKYLKSLKESVPKKSESKNVKWNDDMKRLLTNVEEYSLTCKRKIRSDIYLHLARYFSLSPNTLKKKSRALLIRKLNNNMDEMVIKLAEEIKTFKTCDISSLTEDPRLLQHSAITKFSSKSSEDYRKGATENKVQSELVTIKPLQSCNELNVKKKFVTPAIKDILKTIFCYKRKLYEVRKIKKKHFLDELMDYVREDLVFMWSPLHRPLQPLLDFVASECCDMKVYDTANDKLKENLSIQNVIFANDSKTGCNFPVKHFLKKRRKENISVQKYSSAHLNKIEPRKSVTTTKKISSTLVNSDTNNINLPNLGTKSQNSSKTLNVKATLTKYQKKSKQIVKASTKAKSALLIKKSSSPKTLDTKRNTKPKLNILLKKKSLSDISSVHSTKSTSSPKQMFEIVPKVVLTSNKALPTNNKTLPTSSKILPTSISNSQNSIIKASMPSKLEKVNPNITILPNEPKVLKNIKFLKSCKMSLGDCTAKHLLMQDNNSQMFKKVSNIKFIKAQNIANAKLLLNTPSLPQSENSGKANPQIGSKNLVSNTGKVLKDKVTFHTSKPKSQVSVDSTRLHFLQPKKDASIELNAKDSVPRTVVINIRT